MVNTRSGQELQPVIDRLAELSGGKLRLDVQDYWEPRNTSQEIDAIHALQAGKADIAVVSARPWHETGVTAFDALIAPFTIDSLALEQKVMSSDLPDAMLPAVERLGLKGIGILPGSIRYPVGLTRAFTTLDDFKDARIGHAPSFVEEMTLRSLGAKPVRFIGNATSVQGLDGISIQVAGTTQYADSVRSITGNVPLYPRPIVIVASKQADEKLSAEQREWLRSAVRDSTGPATTLLRNEVRDALSALCRNAWFRIDDAKPDAVAAMHEKVRPLMASLREDAETAQYLDRIEQLRSGVTPYTDETPSCVGYPGPAQPPDPPLARTPVDGTYLTLLPASCDPAPENCGTYHFVFDRGRFAFTQENGPACTWQYGTFTVKGNRVEWFFTDGGGEAPTNSMNKPGDDFLYSWKVYKDELMLTLLSGGSQYPPLRRVRATPDRSYLSTRCPPPGQALP
ncbi:TRAP transporter substrate-binding protein [Intrasporangium mesophilum]